MVSHHVTENRIHIQVYDATTGKIHNGFYSVEAATAAAAAIAEVTGHLSTRVLEVREGMYIALAQSAKCGQDT